MAIRDGGQRTGTQTFILEGQSVPVLVGASHDRDLRHPVGQQPVVHYRKVFIGVRLFATCIGKEDEIYGDSLLVQTNEHGRAVDPAAVAENVHYRPPPVP